jgi:single-strand DNA-binding protein
MFLNMVIISGNLTRDPDFKTTPSGASVCEFTIAINRKFKSGDEVKEEVDFIAVVVWGKVAEACRDYLQKGSGCMVQGRLKQDRWEDHEGKKQSKTKVFAEHVQFLTRKKSGDENN